MVEPDIRSISRRKTLKNGFLSQKFLPNPKASPNPLPKRGLEEPVL
jgi:hypothetical protein